MAEARRMTNRNQDGLRPHNYQKGSPGTDSRPGGAGESRAGIETAELASRLCESARTLLASGNEPEACDALEEAARLGRADAAFVAAVLLLGGGRADPVRGLQLLQVAARQGLKDAALMLGKILWSTQGSHHEGVELLCTAAEAGEAEALYLLGLACFRGQGVHKDLAAARELQLAAAMRGLPDAQFELSLLLAQGLGGDVDVQGARRWEAKAANAGHPRACLNRGARLANSKRPDWAKVARWYARAAAGGNAEAAARLCVMTRDPEIPSSVALVNAAAAIPAPKPDAGIPLQTAKADQASKLDKEKPTDTGRWKAKDRRFSALL